MTDDNGHSGFRSAETARWVIGMGLAALVSYFSTTYGLQARIAVLEVRVKASEANLNSVQALTAQVAALSQQIAVLTAIVDRMERQQTKAASDTFVRPSRMFDR